MEATALVCQWYQNMNRLLKASKAKQCRNTFKIKLGMKIPHYYKEAMMFDYDNGNTNWKDAELLKLKQIYIFDPFSSLVPATSTRIPPSHTKIQVHLIYE